jgi:hypothetical protein
MKIVAAALLLAASLAVSATAHADSVPTVDQVMAMLGELTDPNLPSADKGDVVTPAFTDKQARVADAGLNMYRLFGATPFPFVVSDIQPAPNNMAGATVEDVGTFHTRGNIAPIVLANQGGHWMITRETAINRLNMLFADSAHAHHPNYPVIPDGA